MRKTGRLYLLFSFLTLVLAGMLFGIYRYTPVKLPDTFSPKAEALPEDLRQVLDAVSEKDSWIYRMRLHRKQNVFSYPRTVYHINLN